MNYTRHPYHSEIDLPAVLALKQVCTPAHRAPPDARTWRNRRLSGNPGTEYAGATPVDLEWYTKTVEPSKLAPRSFLQHDAPHRDGLAERLANPSLALLRMREVIDAAVKVA